MGDIASSRSGPPALESDDEIPLTKLRKKTLPEESNADLKRKRIPSPEKEIAKKTKTNGDKPSAPPKQVLIFSMNH
jgi:hypothetical protein